MFQNGFGHFAIDRVAPVASLAEILSAFSYALDLTEGQPEGHSIRSCWIGSMLARHIGLDAAALSHVYYAVMLKDLGCSSNAARIAEIYQTDDRAFKHDYKLVDGSLRSVLGFVFARTAPGQSWGKRAKAIGSILKNGPEIARALIETRCTRGADIARLLRFPEPVAQAIHSLDEYWDGSGKPYGPAGDAIPMGSRIALLAQTVDVFFTKGGPGIDGALAACHAVEQRRGTWFDPALADAFLSLSRDPDFWVGLVDPAIQARVVALEPGDHLIPVDEDYLDDIALAFGQVIDAKSPYTSGHSVRVADYCDLVARHLGYDAPRRRTLRRGAILHDVGKLGVSSAILEKPGKLDADEWHIMQSHAEITTEILGRIAVLRDMALIAGSHHERLDGAGYPRRIDARIIGMDTRIITVCDFYDALTADRPYRAAMTPEKALAIVAQEVGKAIDADCFAALNHIVAQGLATVTGSAALPDLSLLSAAR